MRLPVAGALELRVAELHARQLVRLLGVRRGERRRHVDVRAAGLERGLEDRRVQPRIAGVEDDVGLLDAREVDDRLRVGRVDRRRRVARVAEPVDRGLRPVVVDVRQDELVEEVATARDRGRGHADAARADDEDPHAPTLPPRAAGRGPPRQRRAATSASSASSRPSGCGRAPRRRARSPASRSASLVTGPIETIRGPGERAAPASRKKRTGRGAGEGDVVGAQRGARSASASSGLGDGLVERDHVDLGAALAQRVGQHVARLGGAGDQRRASPATSRERLDQRLGDEPLGHDVGARRRASRSARGGPGADRRDVGAGERAGVAARPPALEQQLARRSGSSGRRGRSVLERRDADRSSGSIRIAGSSTTSAPSARSRRGELAGLRAGPGDDDAAAVQRPRARARRARSRSAATGADDGDRGRADPGLLGDARRSSPRVPSTVRWPGSVPRSTTAAGSSAARPAAISCSAIRGSCLDAHVEDERAGEARPAPSSRARVSGLLGILVAGDEGDRARRRRGG